MKYLLVSLMLLLTLSFAEASDSPSEAKSVSNIESSITTADQVDCVSPDGGATVDTLLSEAKKCCKVCKKGKACGDSCIAKSKTCTKGPGCACNGN
ncbi:hypothetical protein [Idiomarina abyssalis]|uniref:hypothetical protein n=1 Tax=Idiomarina abyssalis TaxID=86102 RepID=UPI003A8D76C6